MKVIIFFWQMICSELKNNVILINITFLFCHADQFFYRHINCELYLSVFQTPLHLAVELQFDQAVSVLLMAGANPSLVNNEGDSAVHLAVKHNTINNLALMLIKSQHKADINARNFEGIVSMYIEFSLYFINITDGMMMIINNGDDDEDNKK